MHLREVDPFQGHFQVHAGGVAAGTRFGTSACEQHEGVQGGKENDRSNKQGH